MKSVLFALSLLCLTSTPVQAIDESALEARLHALEERVTNLEAVVNVPATTPSKKIEAVSTPVAPAEPPKLLLDQEISISRSVLTELLKSKQAAARPLPAFRKGEPVGVRLVEVREDGLFGRLGLQSDDLILSVDGAQLGDPPSIFPLLAALGANQHVTIRVEREEGEMRVNVTVK